MTGNMKPSDFVITLHGTICVIESVDDRSEFPQVHLRALHRNYRDHATVNSVIVSPVGHVAYLQPESWQVRQITERFNGWLLARVGILAYLRLQEQWPHMSCKTDVGFVGDAVMVYRMPIPEPIKVAWPTDDLPPIADLKYVTIELGLFAYRHSQQSDTEHLYAGYNDEVDTLVVRMAGEGSVSPVEMYRNFGAWGRGT